MGAEERYSTRCRLMRSLSPHFPGNDPMVCMLTGWLTDAMGFNPIAKSGGGSGSRAADSRVRRAGRDEGAGARRCVV